jgi:FkbM family methyltransferase
VNRCTESATPAAIKYVLRMAIGPVLRHLSFSLPVSSGKQRVWTPIQEGAGLGVYNQFRSSEEARKLGRFRNPPDQTDGFFVDVGVNLGQTLIQLRQVDSERPYLGFEPNPDYLHYVFSVTRQNGITNVELLAAGLGETTGVLSLYLPRGRSTDSTATLFKDLRPDRRHQSRQVRIFKAGQLTRLIAGRPIGVVKIDVEGAELEVIKGLLDVLREGRPAVMCEVLFTDPKGDLEASRARNAELMGRLSRINYRVLQAHRTSDQVRVEDLAPVSDFPSGYHSPTNSGLADYVFPPSEKAVEWSAGII